MAANYGWALSFLKSNPELWKLFNKSVSNNYSVNRFVASLRNTKWFKSHGEAYRQSQVLQKTDPGTYKQRMAALQSKVHDMAGAMGSQLSNTQANRIANNAMWFGWDDGMIRNNLANFVSQVGTTGHYGGEAGQAEDELRTYAYNMGVKVSDSGLKGWLTNIVAQNQTVDTYKAYIQSQAEHAFPTLADKIKSGVTVKDLADPYIQQMSQTLEMDNSTIGLDDPTIRKALQNTDNKGQFQAQPMWAFEKQLKEDPRWMQTDNARSALVGTAQNVMKDWGFHF